jgi:hypothetical protein
MMKAEWVPLLRYLLWCVRVFAVGSTHFFVEVNLTD